jgi:Oxidoreductase family, NAD-binding Rossmann fold
MINLAVCGLGRWGRRLVESVQHVSAEVRFTHAVSRQPSGSADFTTSNHLAVTTDYAEVLANLQIDGVVLATPHSHHHDEIVTAAKAGKRVTQRNRGLTQPWATCAPAENRARFQKIARRRHTEMGRVFRVGQFFEWCRKRDSNPRPHHYE